MKVVSSWYLLLVVVAVMAFPVLTLAEDEEDLSKSSCDFTLSILKRLVDKNNSSNIVFSPASISILLSVLQQGAKGSTADQLEKVLQLSAEKSRTSYKNFTQLQEEKNVTLEWGNRCYVKPGLELQEGFRTTVEESFNIGVEDLDFGVPTVEDSAKRINDWVKEVTHGHIPDLVDHSSLSTETILVLVNAIYFKGFWLSPFTKGKTAEERFELTPDNSFQTLFMSQRKLFYADKDSELGAKWVQLPFQNRRFAMIFVLPTQKHGLNNLIEKLTGNNLQEIFTHRRPTHVKLRIPKFKISEKVSLVETLKEIGLTDIFSEASDLSGMSSSLGNVHVSDIIHEANVEIDEDGSTGSAATILQLFRSGPLKLSFVADQPFLFFIIDSEAKVPLFAGKVVNPKL